MRLDKLRKAYGKEGLINKVDTVASRPCKYPSFDVFICCEILWFTFVYFVTKPPCV